MAKRNRRRPLPPATTGTAQSLSHDGRGIVSVNGKTTFVRGALAGEEVAFKYTDSHSQYDEGSVTDILSASPLRETPQCPYTDNCGGCSLQHLKPAEQIKHKQQALAELLKHHAKQPQEWLEAITGPIYHYRRKARLSVKHVDKKEACLVGFREHRSRFIADINECVVLTKDIGQKITALRELIVSLDAKAQIPQLEIAAADNQTAIILRHLIPLSENDLKKCTDFANENNFCFFLQSKGIKSIKPLQPEKDASLYYALENYGLKIYFQPHQFLQVNADINQQLIDTSIDWLDLSDNDTVLDLFCGIGNFSLPIAKTAEHVVGIEGDNTAIEQAKENAEINQLKNCEFHCFNLQENADSESWYQQRFNKIVIDPPRSGAKEIIPAIVRWQPEKIIYISCSQSSFARDAGLLIEKGYQLSKLAVADMFPHTQHAESIALFERLNEGK